MWAIRERYGDRWWGYRSGWTTDRSEAAEFETPEEAGDIMSRVPAVLWMDWIAVQSLPIG